MATAYQFIVDRDGMRLDRFVSERAELSRTHARRLIEDGDITVNDLTAKPGQKLAAGDIVRVNVPPPPPSHLVPEDIPLSILYEDDDVMVIDKPAGLTVHPAPAHPGHTLMNAIISHVPGLAGEEGTLRPGIVHRLDKDTSGLILAAKNRQAQAELMAQFQKREVKKVYLALVRGRLSPEQGVIEAALGRDLHNRKKMAVVSRGRSAATEYRVVEYLGGYTLLEVMPKTGRTHQIRVHLAAIGFPVVGDATYGAGSPYLKRQFLHASRLGFRLPSSGEFVEFTAELPADLKQALAAIA